MRPLRATCRLGLSGALVLAVVATAACGGVTQFSDKAALTITASNASKTYGQVATLDRISHY